MEAYYVLSGGTSVGRLVTAFPSVQRLPTAGLQDERPGSLIWYFLAGDSDISGMSEIIAQNSSARMIVLSSQPTAEEALAVFKAGAKGYCHAQAAPAMLQQVATVVEAGGVWLGSEFMPHFLQGVGGSLDSLGQAQDAPDLSALTARELEVVREVCDGASNKEVARRLNITERTVKAHLTAVFEKLAIRDRVQLVIRLKSEITKNN